MTRPSSREEASLSLGTRLSARRVAVVAAITVLLAAVALPPQPRQRGGAIAPITGLIGVDAFPFSVRGHTHSGKTTTGSGRDDDGGDDDDDGDGDYDDDDDVARAKKRLERLEEERTHTKLHGHSSKHHHKISYPLQIGRIKDPDFKGLKLIQLHIPKTGGRSLECTFGDGHRNIEAAFVHRPAYPDMETTVNAGHTVFSVMEWEQWKKEQMAVTVITVRHPVDRLLSAYTTAVGRAHLLHSHCATRRNPLLKLVYHADSSTLDPASHPDPWWYNKETDRIECYMVGHIRVCGDMIRKFHEHDISFEEFAKAAESEFSMNGQVRMIAYAIPKLSFGKHVCHVGDAALGDAWEDVQDVMRTEFDVVMVTERMEESLAALACVIEERTGKLIRNYHTCSNWNPHTSRKGISSELREYLVERNSYDMRLYHLANAELDKRIEKYSEKFCFKHTLEQLHECRQDLIKNGLPEQDEEQYIRRIVHSKKPIPPRKYVYLNVSSRDVGTNATHMVHEFCTSHNNCDHPGTEYILKIGTCNLFPEGQ